MAVKKKKRKNQHPLPSESMTERVELVDLSSIKFWKDNTNKHSKESVNKIAEALEQYGQLTPIVVWPGDRQIRKGNGTYLAAKQLGWKSIYVLWGDFNNKVEADLYGTSDNKVAEWSEVDEEALRKLFSRDDVLSYTGNRTKLADMSSFTEEEIRGIFLEPDFDKIEKIKSEDSSLMSTIKITCSPEDKEEILNILKEWEEECDYEGVEIK